MKAICFANYLRIIVTTLLFTGETVEGKWETWAMRIIRWTQKISLRMLQFTSVPRCTSLTTSVTYDHWSKPTCSISILPNKLIVIQSNQMYGGGQEQFTRIDTRSTNGSSRWKDNSIMKIQLNNFKREPFKKNWYFMVRLFIRVPPPLWCFVIFSEECFSFRFYMPWSLNRQEKNCPWWPTPFQAFWSSTTSLIDIWDDSCSSNR